MDWHVDTEPVLSHPKLSDHAPIWAMAFTTDDARAYIAKVRWQFARTMPMWPHEYTVPAWRPDLERGFCDTRES